MDRMSKTSQLLDLSQIEEITATDPSLKKELISIFQCQIPEFIRNMKSFFQNGNLESLAREAHTAKSSVLIFGMQSTGNLLKDIQLLAEQNKTNELQQPLKQVEADLIVASHQLDEITQNL